MNFAKFVLGLGNPDTDYALTRHNLGHRVLESLLEETGWEEKPALFLRMQARGSNKKRIIFANTLTFMNESGKAAAKLLDYFRAEPESLLVIHDDVDILFGNMKLSFGSRSAGHKGVESVMKALKTNDFWRLRIGIQPELGEGRMRADALILKKFSGVEEKAIPEILKKTHQAIAAWIEYPHITVS